MLLAGAYECSDCGTSSKAECQGTRHAQLNVIWRVLSCHAGYKVMILSRIGVSVVPMYSMISNDLVHGLHDRYVQAQRHCWGVTEVAWVAMCFGQMDLKTWLPFMLLIVKEQLVDKAYPWWVFLCFPVTWRIFFGISPEARELLIGLAIAEYAVTWLRQTTQSAYIFFVILADREAVQKPSWCAFALMSIFEAPLRIVGDIVFSLCATWHCLVHSFFSPDFKYINAPKGRSRLFGAAAAAAAAAAGPLVKKRPPPKPRGKKKKKKKKSPQEQQQQQQQKGAAALELAGVEAAA